MSRKQACRDQLIWKLTSCIAVALVLASCTPVAEDVAESTSGTSQLISFRGTTVVPFGRLLVLVPGAAVPSGNTGCMLEAEPAGRGSEYGLAFDETVWDVRILCDREELQVLFGAITVCIEPADSTVGGQVYQRHGSAGFEALPVVSGRQGYVCGETERLSLFTIG